MPVIDLEIVQLSRPGEADQELRQELTACWIAVTKLGRCGRMSRFPRLSALPMLAPVVDARRVSPGPGLQRGYSSPASAVAWPGGWHSAVT